MKKIVYIDIDEDITSVYDRIKNLKHAEIYLVVPRKALIFQTAVNLKILLGRLSEHQKELIIVTSDPNGKHLAARAGIRTVDSIDVEPVAPPAEDNPQIRIQPIQARRNEVTREQPRRATEKKITIAELVREFRVKHLDGKRGKDDSSGVLPSLGRGNRRFLVVVTMLSAVLFMFISYIALPGATVSIRPKFSDLTHTVNIILADKRKNQQLISVNRPHVIPSEIVTTVSKQTKVFTTTSQEFEGVNARGKISIINASPDEWPLKGGTRFQTPDGLIFRIKADMYVPGAVTDAAGKTVNGQLSATVTADPFDLYGKPVGDRGNIGPVRFILPGLSKQNQPLLWAESVTPMTGGVSQYRLVVKKEDIEAAKQQIQDDLLVMAKDDLRVRTDEMNQLNHTNLVLLDDSRYLKTDLVELKIPDDLEGSARDKFEVFAKIKAEGIAYDQDMLFSMLKQELSTRVHPDMQLRMDSVSPDQISYEVISEDDAAGQIKVTVTVKGIEEYIIDPSLEAGKRFGSKVRDKVLGMSVDEASGVIANLPEVDAVTIKTWPFWLSTMPGIPDNIEIKRMESE